MHITNAKDKFLKFFPKTVGKAVEEVRRMKSYLKCSYVMTGKPSQYTVLLRKWQPTPALLPGKSHGWRSLVGYSLWGRKEMDTTEQLHFFTLTPSGAASSLFPRRLPERTLWAFTLKS